MSDAPLQSIPPFEHRYDPPDLHVGEGALDDLGAALDRHDAVDALVVCGESVGANDDLQGLLEGALENRLAGVYARSTTSSDVDSARAGVDLVFEGIDRLRETGADAVLGVGGGASIDFARAIRLLANADRTPGEVVDAVEDDGRIHGPPAGTALPPMVAVPTTLAGADCSIAGGLKFKSVDLGGGETAAGGGGSGGGASGEATDSASTDAAHRGRVDTPTAFYLDRRLMPTAAVYDPAVFATTPAAALCASAMNGFNKGIEALYSRHATPIVDATAKEGLAYLRRGLPGLRAAAEGAGADPGLAHSVVGTVLVQQGLAAAGPGKLSILHAFGHALSQRYAIHQGAAHAMVTPAALEFVFEHSHARRDAIAAGLGVAGASADDAAGTDDGALAEAIVDEVREIRDALGVPTRLRTVEGLARDDLPAVAEAVLADHGMANGPADLDPDRADVEGILRDAW